MHSPLPEHIRTRYNSIWAQIPDVRLHDNNTFGHLTVDVQNHTRFRIQYENAELVVWPDRDCVELIHSAPAEAALPDFYLIERIGYPFLRLLSGYTLLHCGAVMCTDGCIGLLSQPGVGKSTLTAAILNTLPASKLVSDDILPVFCDDNKVIATPSASYIAMRHALFDHSPFVVSISDLGLKKALRVHPQRCLTTPKPLKSLVILHADNQIGPIHPAKSKSSVLADILRQQMTLSNPPPDFVRAQFGAIMQIVEHIPIFELSISMHSAQNVKEAVAQILQAA